MKKIPTLFKRNFENHIVTDISKEVAPKFEWVLSGDCIATVKWDGACWAIIDGEFYKRYDAKQEKPVPNGAIKCQEVADPITGHFPCWVKCDYVNPTDDDTYEAIGVHFQSNPYRLDNYMLNPHLSERHSIEEIIF